jgi:uncharacterized protein YjiS (DUF1127 family)
METVMTTMFENEGISRHRIEQMQWLAVSSIARLWNAYQDQKRRKAELRALVGMNNNALKDIGLTRGELIFRIQRRR